MKPLLIKGLFPIALILLLCSMDQAAPKKYQLTKGVTAKLPGDFLPMPDDDIASKYPSTKKPLAMFTTPDRMIDFGLNVTKSSWAGNDLQLLKEIYKSTLYTLYTEVVVLSEDIKIIHKQDFVTLEFTSRSDGTKKYTYLQYGIFNNKVYIFNFTCSEREMPKWRETASEIMASIKVKPGQLEDIIYNPSGENTKKGKSPMEVLKDQKQRTKNGQKPSSK
jgi:hypothetical protein